MLPTYLQTTSTGFFFRMYVPKSLQPILKKTELKRAIRTTNRAVAERQAIIYAGKALELFDSLKEPELTDVLFSTIKIASLKRYPDGTVEMTGLETDPNHPEAEEKAFNNIMEKFQCVPVGDPTVAAATPLTAVPAMRLSEAVNLFITARSKKAAKRNTLFDEKAARVPFKLLTEYLGEDKYIREITLADAELFQEKLRFFPRVRTTNARLGLTFNQLISLKETDTISENTQGQHIGKLSGLWNWLNESKTLSLTNPFYGLADKKIMHRESPIRKRQAFDATDLQKIFAHGIWTDCQYKSNWEYFLAPLLLYTGARVNEIVQLEKKDILTVDGILCISINDLPTKDEPDIVWEAAPKRVKNSSSRREIPVHSALINLGFLDFVETIKSGRLFPDIKPIVGKLAKTPCRRFNEDILVEVGVKIQHRKTFYSFRHTTMNTLKQLRVNLEERGQLAGHTQSKITSTYGDEYSISDMQILVERLNFSASMPGVKPWTQG